MILDKTLTAEQIQDFLVTNLAELLKIKKTEIDVNENLENYGLDSSQAMMIVSKLEKLLKFKANPVLLWHSNT